MNTHDVPAWEYFKLYFGAQGERADAFVIELHRRMTAVPMMQKWFYMRYIDEAGFHIRLRFLPDPGAQQVVSQTVRRECGEMLNRMYEFLPSAYLPMVTLPDYIVDSMPAPKTNTHLRIEVDTYVPESEKYGSHAAIPISEDVFHLSSDLAGQILADEAAELYSRKTLAPWLMHESAIAFPVHRRNDFWLQYSLYWLGGDSPAAQDWRTRFNNKAQELRDGGYPVLAPEHELPVQAAEILRRWRAGLTDAARAYKAMGESSNTRPDVLSLNFAHLMMNRLGIGTLEESYLATLLDGEQGVAVEAAA